eukprot:GHVU01016010.1.p1 GENE.GHVU01016010.1~~GHVU01016010.1.p1  ORF type:complete len:170 (+),score=8.73 GHVU01016010.1:144-653(+)
MRAMMQRWKEIVVRGGVLYRKCARLKDSLGSNSDESYSENEVSGSPGTDGGPGERLVKKTAPGVALKKTECSRSSSTQYLPVPKAHHRGPAAYQMSHPDGGHCTKCTGRNRNCTCNRSLGQPHSTSRRCPCHYRSHTGVASPEAETQLDATTRHPDGEGKSQRACPPRM